MENNEGDNRGNSGKLQSIDMLHIQNSIESEQAVQIKHQKPSITFMDETMAAQSAGSSTNITPGENISTV